VRPERVNKWPNSMKDIWWWLSWMHVGLHVKYPLFLSDFNLTWFFGRFSKNVQISNVMKIRPLLPDSLHGDGGQRDGRTGGYDEANSRFSQCWRDAYRGSWYIVTKRKLLKEAHGVHNVKLRYVTSGHTYCLIWMLIHTS